MICASYTRERIMFGEAISITEQNEKIAEFLKCKRLKLDVKFSDRKADINAEEGFMDMKEAGINRKFDCIVFWSMMYFGKDPLVGYNLLLHTFIPTGLEFAVVCDNFSSIGKSADEIEAYLESKYRERREAHYQNIEWVARTYRMNTLYGYKKHEDEFEIDSNAEPIVRDIFRMALEKKPVREIVTALNQRKVEDSRHYLHRVAGRDLENIPFMWDSMSVKKILTDSRYKGERMVTKKGVSDILPMPSYISAEEYDAIQEQFHKRGPIKKWINPLSKKVFDKETHITLCAGNYNNDGKRLLFLARNAKEIQYARKSIPTETVLEETMEQLKQEQIQAKRALFAKSTESGQMEYKHRKIETKEKLESNFSSLLEEVASIEGGFSDDTHTKINELDEEFSRLQGKLNVLDIAFGEHNPWLDLYSTMEIPEELSRDFCEKYVDEVLVTKFENAELIPKHAEWKALLPSYWMEG